jgi:protein-tyrosine phosphatase
VSTQFDSAPNFRDLGGIPTSDGRKVRTGVLFRSEEPDSFSEQDLQEINRLGIRTVCDLRSRAEAGPEGPVDRILDAVRLSVPVLPELRTGGDELHRLLVSDPTGEVARENMRRSYSMMAEVFEEHFSTVVDRILDGGLPMLVHCTAGKDRSGFVVALILRAVGVAPEDVLADYLASGTELNRQKWGAIFSSVMHPDLASKLSPEILDAMSIDESYLAAALRAAEESHGDLESYLQKAGGLDGEKLGRLKDALLE